MNKKGKIALIVSVILLLAGTAAFAQSRGGENAWCGPRGGSGGCGSFGGGNYDGERGNGNGGGSGGFGCH